ncbi:MAG: cyclopropane-fatty-acyl-phospholipid synthase family protein [Thiobacillus sp.]|uniref:cyclopropane-fatty-acyl-phospholipid synthase family protein n=1 Tax=Thiobacillus sp. TaxID=924 RepID=UPI0028956445|nr:cyclopropane-fatty-acyl-phospholipid synthase family protein [Thiobacillus sp.]MDT3706207.1 cyclopropane-fatty-acyl-phospholipid synthase family protein [Thiobacillus sp.]
MPVVRRVLRGYPGNLAVRLWDGETLEIGGGPPDFTLVFRHPAVFRELILFRDPLRLAEAYFLEKVDIEGDLYAALRLKDHLQSMRLSAIEKAAFLSGALLLGNSANDGMDGASPGWRASLSARLAGKHSRARDRQAIAFHYDVSNDFYRLWLDEQMVYSCAYFEEADDNLDQAQRNKLDHLCRKLRLKPGERLLDIGCGWGALIRWAAVHYGVEAHGITLSRNQYEYCLRQIAERGLQGRVSVELKDYRDMAGDAQFDKIVSVGMFEHVGIKNLPVYFGTAQRLLKPGGLFLNHGITHDSEGWQKSVSTQFINRYVFPDGELDTVSNAQRAMERAGFEILDVEALRPHYALTLRHWVRGLEAHREEALRHVSEPTYRVWRLYMAACALAFEEGSVGVYQILAARRTKGLNPVPLTRRDVYSPGDE